MSVEAVSAAIQSSAARPTARLVLLILSEAANRAEGHEAWPAVDTIGRRCGLDRRRVQRALRELEEAGEIGRVGEGRGGRAGSSRYRMLLVGGGDTGTAPRDASAAGDAGTAGGDTGTARGAAHMTGGGDTGTAQSVKNQNRNPARERGADRAAPAQQNGNHNGSTKETKGRGRPNFEAVPGVSLTAPCVDCDRVAELHLARRCRDCYDEFEARALAEHDMVEQEGAWA